MTSGSPSPLDRLKSVVRRLADMLYLRPEELAFLLAVCALTLAGALVSTFKGASPAIAEDGQAVAFKALADRSVEFQESDSSADLPESPSYFIRQRDSLARLLSGEPRRTQVDSFFDQLRDAPVRVVNLNEATAADLASLPGIGQKLAQRIIDYRTAQGPFSAVEDLRHVKGIGKKLFAKIQPFIDIH